MPALKLQDPDNNLLRMRKDPIMSKSITGTSDLPCINVESTDDTDQQQDSEMGGVTTTKEIKMDTINETGENVDDVHSSGSDGDIEMFVESKYCTVCHLEQPLRTKHCKSCDQCIATHDHHCPWIGNCVGERNKARFYYYLLI